MLVAHRNYDSNIAVKAIAMCKYFIPAFLLIYVRSWAASDIAFVGVDLTRNCTCTVAPVDLPDILACARLCRVTKSCNAIETKTTDGDRVACFLLTSEYLPSTANETVLMKKVRNETSVDSCNQFISDENYSS